MKKEGKLTNCSTHVVDRIRLPEFLLDGCEAELGEDKGGDKCLEIWLQESPRRFRFDTIEELKLSRE